LSYTPGIEEVFLNGVLLTRDVDYFAASGTSITSLVPLTAGDEVTVLGWTPFNVLGAIDGSNLIDGTVTGNKIQDGSISISKIQDGSISISKIQDGSVVDAKVATNAAISSTKLRYLQAGTGAQPRTVQDRLRDWVNVKDFGAVGDFIVGGSINSSPTDNLAAFQAAFQVSKRVYVPRGYYYLSNTLTLPRFGELFALDLEATHLISGSATAVIDSPLGLDNLRIEGIRFDSTTKCAGISFGSPPGNDFSTGVTLIRCQFGNSLSFVYNGKAQLLRLDRCGVFAPIYHQDGNYLTIDQCLFIWNSVPSNRSRIAGISFGDPGTGYFNSPAIRIDSGHSQVVNNSWFEDMPSSAIYTTGVMVGITISNNKMEKASNGPTSQSSLGGGWFINITDPLNVLQGGLIYGNSAIGNVGRYTDLTTFTPDCLGFLGGNGLSKCTVIGNSMGFFEIAKAPPGGYRAAEFKPYISDLYVRGQFANSGGFAITPNPSNGINGAFLARSSSTQAFAHNVYEKVLATTEDYDLQNWFATSRYTPKLKGYYKITAAVYLDTTPASTGIELVLYKNGSFFRTLNKINNGATETVMISGNSSFEANGTTDFFEVFLKQSSGTAISTISSTDAVRIEGELISY
jgi:hypothetical protein